MSATTATDRPFGQMKAKSLVVRADELKGPHEFTVYDYDFDGKVLNMLHTDGYGPGPHRWTHMVLSGPVQIDVDEIEA